jgi:predicted transcriptional regulator
MGPIRIDVPSAKPWLAHALKSKDLSHNQIARTLHVSAVTVRKWLNKTQAEWAGNPTAPQPLPLFPDLD